jgi:hypothetical protein
MLIFWLGNCFGYFSKNWATFFQSSGHPDLPGWKFSGPPWMNNGDLTSVPKHVKTVLF